MGLKNLVDDNTKNMSKNNINRQYKRCLGCNDYPVCEERLPLYSKDNRCSRCNREFNRERNKRYKKIKDFYGSIEWKNKRNEVKDNSYHLCEICAARGILKDAEHVHHIVSVWIKEGFDKRLDDSNLISLCEECHNQVHNKDIELLYGLSGYVESFIEDGVETELCKSMDDVYQRIMNQ